VDRVDVREPLMWPRAYALEVFPSLAALTFAGTSSIVATERQ
jgi:hypothetical protein